MPANLIVKSFRFIILTSGDTLARQKGFVNRASPSRDRRVRSLIPRPSV
jgi:hypothetical protein